MNRKVTLVALLTAIAGVVWYVGSREPSKIASSRDKAFDNEASSVPAATGTTPSALLSQRTDSEAAVGQGAAITPNKARLEISETEERVLEMYDEIASALADEQKDCDVLGTALSSSVDTHARDLQRWAQTQKELAPAELAADNQRLLRVAGDRMHRAQEAIRRAMGKCVQSEKFQDALRDLSELGTPS